MSRVNVSQFEEHLPGEEDCGFSPRPRVDANGKSAVAQAGGVLLTGTVRAAGLDVTLSGELALWRKPLAVHDPAKVRLDLALTLALGGDTCSDLTCTGRWLG